MNSIRTIFKKLLPSAAQNLVRRAVHGRFYVLQRETGGLLSPKQYERIYTEALRLPDLDVVEIGGAAGTASIAIGWAMKRSRKNSRLIIVEKCEGGTRAQVRWQD